MEDKLNIDFCFVDEDKLVVEVLRIVLVVDTEVDINDVGDAEAVASNDTL